MTTTKSQVTGQIARLARAVAAALRECHQATRRMAELSTAPDRYLPDPGRPPATYAEFLYRTSGVLAHEPPARRRARALP